MTPETLQEVDTRSKAAKAVLTDRSLQELPEADRFIALRCGRREAFRNRLKDALKPRRLDPPENLPPEHQIANRTDRARRVRAADDFLEQFVARA